MHGIITAHYCQHILSQSPKPRNRECYGRKGVWCKNTLGCMAGLALAVVNVVAAGLLRGQ